MPNRNPESYAFEARGAMTARTLADGATESHQYDKVGAHRQYVDPTTQDTNTATDLLGRPTVTTCKDGTTEPSRTPVPE